MLIEPVFILWVLVLILLIWLIFSSRIFVFLDNKTDLKQRDEHLDELRFFLAFLVAVHHYAYCYVYFQGK